ncbi:hypothetical protein GCM10028805_54920 [Spirosoma harenae]
MIWKKSIYDALTNCAAVCNDFATECSGYEDIEIWYRSILLNLDCADMCRHLATFYVRGSENARLLAKTCIEVCDKCAQEVSQFKTERSQQIYTVCQQTIQCCVSIIDMGYQTDIEARNRVSAPSSLFYGIDLRETHYN